ncbi:MAG: hypothetical protein JEZ10_09210 [Verrucomicrobia bacterium]|nr:hypothetical protein [Verrucomicrobiota bacterium]
MNTNAIKTEALEKYSSAITLSDMEIFVFPELLYALLLANIMSPRIWAWRDDPWFAKIDKMSPTKKVNRLKQYIIDHYEFNLDLDTWGLTDQQTELDRFSPFMDAETISRSNALFGYQGDQHYFDLDIRRHFGLEKYDSTVIPYWKTETVEAMDAFARRAEYRVGAGECVSLSTLYAAALFIICKIPLKDIFLMATPLHSQNFIAYNGGFLTNNRRIVTKAMWFNGTELTDKAQRALRNEQITMVFNNSGYVHCIYPDSTMDPAEYDRFKSTIGDYLSTEITFEILANFLRQNSRFQKCFQICHNYHGKKRWIAAERAYAYEHAGPYKVSDNTRDKLLEEIDAEEFYCDPLPDRICLPKLEEFFKNNPIKHFDPEHMAELGKKLECQNEQKNEMLAALAGFVHLEPEFPAVAKAMAGEPTIGKKSSKVWKKVELTPDMERGEIIQYVESIRTENQAADLAFYALRDMSRSDWTPFLKAALERNPVCIEATKELSDDELFQALENMDSESIYDGSRLAQPDEVWNFQTGDGLEKAILLSNVWLARHRSKSEGGKKRRPEEKIELTVAPDRVELKLAERVVAFESSKGLTAKHAL